MSTNETAKTQSAQSAQTTEAAKIEAPKSLTLALATLAAVAAALPGFELTEADETALDSFAPSMEGLKTWQATASEQMAAAARRRETAAMAALGAHSYESLESLVILAKTPGGVFTLTPEAENSVITWTVAKMDASDYEALTVGTALVYEDGFVPSKVTTAKAAKIAEANANHEVRIKSDLATWHSAYFNAPLKNGRRDAATLAAPFEIIILAADGTQHAARLGTLAKGRKRG